MTRTPTSIKLTDKQNALFQAWVAKQPKPKLEELEEAFGGMTISSQFQFTAQADSCMDMLSVTNLLTGDKLDLTEDDF